MFHLGHFFCPGVAVVRLDFRCSPLRDLQFTCPQHSDYLITTWAKMKRTAFQPIRHTETELCKEHWHPRSKRTCKFIGTKGSVYIRKELNSYSIGLVKLAKSTSWISGWNSLGREQDEGLFRKSMIRCINMAGISSVWNTNMAALTSCENALQWNLFDSV